MSTGTTPSIMQRLKDETWSLHQQAERQPLEQHLVRGALSRPAYARFLAQRLAVHHALEAVLASVRASHPAFEAIVHDRHFHSGRLEQDLHLLGLDPGTVEPLPAAYDLIRRLHSLVESTPVAILGVLYVFEGSTNGARFIARAVRQAYGLQGEDGTRYLDPYGENQRAYWGAFKEAMNAFPFTKQEEDAIVSAGIATFEFLIAVDAQIWESLGTSVA